MPGHVNPEDNADADVFVGSGGPHHGRFHKGAIIDDAWQPDEHKWFIRMTDDELNQTPAFFGDARVVRDLTILADENAVHADIRRHCGMSDDA